MSEVIPLIRWGSVPETPQEALRMFDPICRGMDIKSIVIIALDEDGNVISTGCGYDEFPYTMVGALEKVKQKVMENIE